MLHQQIGNNLGFFIDHNSQLKVCFPLQTWSGALYKAGVATALAARFPLILSVFCGCAGLNKAAQFQWETSKVCLTKLELGSFV